MTEKLKVNVTVVLNACSPTIYRQSAEVLSFLKNSFYYEQETVNGKMEPLKDTLFIGETVILYCDEEKKAQLPAAAVTKNVHLVRINDYDPEYALTVLEELAGCDDNDLYIFPGDYAGRELVPRLACRLGGRAYNAVESIVVEGDGFSFKKRVYNGYLQGTFKTFKKPVIVSIDPYDAAFYDGGVGIYRSENAVIIEEDRFFPKVKESDMRFKDKGEGKDEVTITPLPDTGLLKGASFIIAAGRGVNSGDKAEIIRDFARAIGAEVGFSRPVVMDSRASFEELIGASGSRTSPEVCLALAVSGSPAFYYGIEKSKKIVAVNTDNDAPIIKKADIAIIDDFVPVLKELFTVIKKNNCKAEE